MSSLVLNTEKIFPEFSQSINFVPSSRVFGGNGDSISDINPFQLAAGVFGVTVAGGISNAFTKNSLSKLFSSGVTSLAAQGGARVFQEMPLSPLGKLGLLLAGGAVFHVVHRAYNYAVMGQQWQGLPNELLSGISTVVMFAGAAGVMSLATPKIAGLALSEPAKRFALLATEYAFFSAYEPLEAGVLSVFNGGNFKEAAAHSFTAKAFVERAAFMAGCKAAHPVSARFERATTRAIESVRSNPLPWAVGATAVTTAIASGANPLHVLGASAAVIFPSLSGPKTSVAQQTLDFLKAQHPSDSILVEVNPTDGNAYYKLASSPDELRTHQDRPVPRGSGRVSFCARRRDFIPTREIYVTHPEMTGFQKLGEFVGEVGSVHIRYQTASDGQVVKNLVIHGGDSLHALDFVGRNIGMGQHCYTVYNLDGVEIYFRKDTRSLLSFDTGDGPIEIARTKEIIIDRGDTRVTIESADSIYIDDREMICSNARSISRSTVVRTDDIAVPSDTRYVVHTFQGNPSGLQFNKEGHIKELRPWPPSESTGALSRAFDDMTTPKDPIPYEVGVFDLTVKISVPDGYETTSGLRQIKILLPRVHQ